MLRYYTPQNRKNTVNNNNHYKRKEEPSCGRTQSALISTSNGSTENFYRMTKELRLMPQDKVLRVVVVVANLDSHLPLKLRTHTTAASPSSLQLAASYACIRTPP